MGACVRRQTRGSCCAWARRCRPKERKGPTEPNASSNATRGLHTRRAPLLPIDRRRRVGHQVGKEDVYCKVATAPGAVIGENRQLGTDEPVELEK